MDINRKTAYYTLMDIETKKSFSNLSLNHHIIVCNPPSPAFVRELVYGVLENKLLLDYIIDKLVPTGAAKVKTSDLVVLRMGIYQLGYMDKVPEYAAVNESVNLAKKFCKGRQGFINGVLRTYTKENYTIKLPDRTEDEIRYLSIKYSYAPWIIRLWLERYDIDFVEELLAAGNETPDVTIRMNWLKTMKPDLIRRLNEKGFETSEGKLCKNAIHVKGSGLLNNVIYKHGYFSVQDEASMLTSEKLDPQKGDLIMDVCAAPGGKTFAIAERMDNKGLIIASDIYKRKLDIIDKEAKRLGVKIVQTRTWDATRVDSSMIGKADRVLLDAPCSGLGVIRRKPEIKYKNMDSEMKTLPIKQRAILEASANYVKPGGILLYSTCTINHYENDRIVNDFLNSSKEFEELERIQLFPNVDGTDGFFICKMRRIKTVTNN